MIQKLVAENDKQRYQLVLEPNTGITATAFDDDVLVTNNNATGTWWIRANQGHTLKVFYLIHIIHCVLMFGFYVLMKRYDFFKSALGGSS